MNEAKKKKYFALAALVSRQSTCWPKLGCVIVKKNRVVGMGCNNTRKTHPKANTPFKTIHAEFQAMLGVNPEDLKGATVFVYREDAFGKPIISAPCEFCQKALAMAGIKKVFNT